MLYEICRQLSNVKDDPAKTLDDVKCKCGKPIPEEKLNALAKNHYLEVKAMLKACLSCKKPTKLSSAICGCPYCAKCIKM